MANCRKMRLAVGQMTIQPGAVNGNIERATGMIRTAAEQDCRLIVLPECLDVGWTDPSATELAVRIPGQ